MPLLWMRELRVVLMSQKFKKRIEIGTKYDDNGTELNQFDISIIINKYLSTLKDNCVIKIKNLSYSEIIPLLKGKYYGLEIWCGYRGSTNFRVFKGEVLYMSNNIIGNGQTNELVILGASALVARFGQNRMNMTLASGMNLYSVLKFIGNRYGLTSINIDESLKNRYLREPIVLNNTIQSFLDTICNNYNYIASSDESNGSQVSVFNPNKRKLNVIRLDTTLIQLENGYPTLDIDGVQLTCKPSFNFKPGDIIKIDNSLLNISVTNYTHNVQEFSKDYYLDPNGNYIIYEVKYTLNNRSDSFDCDIKAKSKNLLQGLTNQEE